MNDVSAKLGEPGVELDWLRKYTTNEGINFSKHIHDDYFLATKLTFNAGLHQTRGGNDQLSSSSSGRSSKFPSSIAS